MLSILETLRQEVEIVPVWQTPMDMNSPQDKYGNILLPENILK